ncbi:hypothetical protein DOTSEDRAFT_48761 [Dothistroma septosporum NZE10]|uniref:Uncharacterized protein n=1 Tax=Dothistroma septosporum (strain NZE10 / CBS 128990) TaxID=675120 RepID=N1PCK6_DOTSN|nr:hypothetical protein DOTSEDRAFT_48761 [Dothistroma septosporum NZE10]
MERHVDTLEPLRFAQHTSAASSYFRTLPAICLSRRSETSTCAVALSLRGAELRMLKNFSLVL